MNRTKKAVLQSRCKRLPKSSGHTGVGETRTLNHLVAPDAAEWPVNCASQAELCAVVRRVHKERAIMAAVSNRNILGMLGQVRTQRLKPRTSAAL